MGCGAGNLNVRRDEYAKARGSIMLIHRGGITDEESITDRALPELRVQ